MGCYECESINPCNCPTPQELEKIQQEKTQEAHENSIKRQKAKLKVVPWRSDESRGDFIP
jgi:hypothetical protein